MGTLNYRIIDNFLEKQVFKNIQELIMSNNFPWFFEKHQIISEHSDGYYFSHTFYKNNKINSNYFENMVPILEKLDCKALSEIRANLTTNKNKNDISNWHVDRTYPCYTSVFYINNNNGYTLLNEMDKIKIESIENRMLIFDSNIKHAAVSQTDTDNRLVINFNYF
jgi:hypothetical protein